MRDRLFLWWRYLGSHGRRRLTAMLLLIVLHQMGYWGYRVLTEDVRMAPLLAISAAATAAAIAYDQRGWRRIPRQRRGAQR